MRLFLFVFVALGFGLGAAQAQEPTPATRTTMIFPANGTVPITEQQPLAPGPTNAAKMEDPAGLIDVFFLSLKANQVDAAVDALVKDTIVADKKEDVDNMKARIKQALDGFGPISGYEVVSEQKVGTVLFRRTCISLNTDLPLRWRFYFYKSDGKWRLVDFRLDDGVAQLFDDAAKEK